MGVLIDKSMAKIAYKFIVQSPNKMRYPTVGDYYKTKNGWVIVSADLGNSNYNFLVFLHEFIELYLTQRRGISEPKIKKFDKWFERERSKGHFKQMAGPGRHPKSPYRREHIFAEKVERMLIKELGISQKQQVKTEDKIHKKIQKFKSL